MAIAFKTEQIRQEWESGELDRRLKGIVLMLAGYLKTVHNYTPLTITSIFRPFDPKNPRSPHPHWRGVDIRDRDMPNGVADAGVAWCNRQWPYDKKRPALRTALRHNVGKGSHIHLQIMEDSIDPKMVAKMEAEARRFKPKPQPEGREQVT